MTDSTKPLVLVASVLALLLVVGVWFLGSEAEEFEIGDSKIVEPNQEVGKVPRHANDGMEEETPVSADQNSSAALPAPVDLSMADRDRDLHGIVVDMDGGAIAGATIRTFTNPWKRANGLYALAFDHTKYGPETKSAKDGTFSITLKRGQRVNLRATADGFGAAELQGCQAGQKIRIELVPAATLMVECVDVNDQPVEGIELRHTRPDVLGPGHVMKGRTDKNGQFQFLNLSRGHSVVECIQTRYGTPQSQQLQIKPGEQATMRIVLPHGRRLIGCIRDKETKAPISGAKVGIGWTMRSFVLSDASGHYEFPNYTKFPANDIHVSAHGYGRSGKQVPNVGDLDFELSRADSVVGRLFGQDGKVVANVHVEVVATMRRTREQEIDAGGTLSDAEGRFRIENLRRDMPHTLFVAAQGHGRFLLDFDPHPQGPGEVNLGNITLPGARFIGGRVQDARGNPIASTRLTLKGFNSDRGRLRRGKPLAFESFYAQTEDCMTDDLGRYRFSDLAPGSYKVFLRLGGLVNPPKSVELTANKDEARVDFKLANDGVLRFLCIDENNSPVSGVRVIIQDSAPGGKSSVGYSDETGVAEFQYLPVVEYSAKLWTSKKFIVPPPFNVTPNGKDIEVRLKQSAMLKGKLVTGDGSRAGGLWVRASWGQESSNSERSEDGGQFSIKVPQGIKVNLNVTGHYPAGRSGQPKNPSLGRLDGVVAPTSGLVLTLRSGSLK